MVKSPPCHMLGGSSWGRVVFFMPAGGLALPVQPAGCRVTAAVPPWQGKLAVTHQPHQPCLLGDSSCNPSHCYCQPLLPPWAQILWGAGRMLAGLAATHGGYPLSLGDPTPHGHDCIIGTLFLCPGLVVPDSGQGVKKVILHSFFPVFPPFWGNPKSLPQGPPSSCSQPVRGTGRGGVLLGLFPSPEQYLGLS